MDLRDERGIIVSWLVKLVIALAIVGVVLFDAGAIAVNAFTLSSTAGDIATALSTTVQQSGTASINENQLENQAQELADDAGAKLVSVTVDTNARIVKVRLRRSADTLIVRRVDPISKWGRATADGQSGYQ